MEKLLLVVEDSFQLAKIGLVLAPLPAADWFDTLKAGHVETVRLERPDASSEEVEAAFEWQHFNPGGSGLLCVLRDGKKIAGAHRNADLAASRRVISFILPRAVR